MTSVLHNFPQLLLELARLMLRCCVTPFLLHKGHPFRSHTHLNITWEKEEGARERGHTRNWPGTYPGRRTTPGQVQVRHVRYHGNIVLLLQCTETIFELSNSDLSNSNCQMHTLIENKIVLNKHNLLFYNILLTCIILTVQQRGLPIFVFYLKLQLSVPLFNTRGWLTSHLSAWRLQKLTKLGDELWIILPVDRPAIGNLLLSGPPLSTPPGPNEKKKLYR